MANHLEPVTTYLDKHGNPHPIVGRLCCKTPFVVYQIRDSGAQKYFYIGMAENGVCERFKVYETS